MLSFAGRLTLNDIRRAVIGRDLAFPTPFGPRHLFYADYTASGRLLDFVEKKLLDVSRSYANTHTEDDYTGKTMARRFKEAERRIKASVNAGPHDKIFPTGSGSTGALEKLQEMLGVYLPPVTRERFEGLCRTAAGRGLDLGTEVKKITPVVFIGPCEHHTNELMWREAFAEVVVGQDEAGGFDLRDLERKLDDPAFAGRAAGRKTAAERRRPGRKFGRPGSRRFGNRTFGRPKRSRPGSGASARPLGSPTGPCAGSTKPTSGEIDLQAVNRLL